MSEQMTLNDIEENLNFFNKMYDAVRLVDPLQKRVLEYHKCYNSKGYTSETSEICYDYWEKGKVCDNCISIRAGNYNKSFIKLEQKGDMLIMVTAIPVKTDSGIVILELMKNVTDSMMFGSFDENYDASLSNMISELNKKIILDSLTSLHNRRYIDEYLPVDIVNAVLTKTPLSVAFIDIDDFKFINDTYGHSAGDLILRSVSDVIKSSIRKDYDWAARYGGDEFLICMSRTTHEEAHDICKRIRRNIESKPINIKSTSIKARISLGVHTMNEKRFTAEEMINLADKKMYEDKKHRKELQ